MAWLGTWKKRRKITISNTNIDSALSDFPILVKISASSGTGSADITDIFSELGSDANRKKIAITIDDGETQCYVEIERFDYTNSAAWLWVKVPSASDSVGTELYIYYDSSQSDNTTYIGDTTDAAAQSVWDANFKLVMHMAQDPNGDVADAIKDSTSNTNHGTPVGAMATADLVDSKIGKGIEFNGSSQGLGLGDTFDSIMLGSTAKFTVESIVRADSVVGGRYLNSKYNAASNNRGFRFFTTDAISFARLALAYENKASGNYTVYGGGTTLVSSTWYSHSGTYDATQGSGGAGADRIGIFINGIKETLSVLWAAGNPSDIEDNTAHYGLGAILDTTGGYESAGFDGIICESRISDILRSDAWIKATYYSNWDELVTYGYVEPLEMSLSPFLSTSSIQADIQISLSNNLFSSTSLFSTGEIFKGLLIGCPSPMSAQSSLQSAAQIEITESLFTSNSSLQSNAEILLSNNLFTSTSLMSIDEIFCGYFISYPSPMSAQLSLQSDPQIEVKQSLFTSTGSLCVQPEIQLFTGSLSATGSISATITDPFSVAILPRVYTFTLTGAANGIDDIVIPIKSFQSRLKSSDPTYLSVVIPSTDYASAINSRLNGDLVVRMGYLSNSEIILSEIISIVDFENIIIYDGTTNKTITLDGHRTETFTPKEINLTGSSYKNLTAGKLRYRCTPNLYVRPGDTVNIDDDSFTIKNITYSVSPELETFEVSE